MIEIVKPTSLIAAEIAANMRDADARECDRLGQTPQEAVFSSVRASLYCRAAVEGGEALAIWGVTGNLLDESYVAWLLTAKGAERHKTAFLRIGRSEVAKMAAAYPKLWNVVDAEYSGALRLVAKLGFVIHPSAPLNGAPFHRIERT